MPHDSEHRGLGLSTPDEAPTQQDSVSSYSCSHCVLIFKTRFYLYEHLHQVHGLGIEAALRDSGLKTLPQSKPKPENKAKTLKSDFAFNCKNCSFKSCNWSVFNEHKNQCSISSVSPNNGSPIPNASIFFKPQKSPASSQEINSVKATPKSTSKDVKIYSKSPQTITKYFTVASTVKSHHQAKEKDTKTISLEGSSLKSSGVFQVKATSIDMGSMNTAHLLSDLISDPTSAKPVDPFKEATLNNTSKRTSKESVESDPSKKVKLETNQPNHTQTSNCAELSFEVSDDEEAKDIVHEEAAAINSYICKHCDFKSTSMEHVYSHYEENHPYLRYNSFYIEEKTDQSATFRCLECPVEFSSDTQLRNHYEDHPDAPDIFNLKSADLNLVYKCFVCPFTSSILQSLREHHKEKHPSLKVENPLLYHKYTQHSVNDTKSRSSEEEEEETLHSERSTTPCQDERSPSLSPKPQPKAQDGILYYCGKCTFSHKSVVVLHVHYKKCHPQEPITLDKIKQSVGAPSVTASAQTPDLKMDLSQSLVEEETLASPLADPETISESISVERMLQPAPLTAELDCPASSSLNKMFFCDQCNFSNSNIKSVISHHNAKHGSATTIEDVLQHTAAMENKTVESKVSNSVPSVYPCAQELYYCQLCNYGNPTLKGVLGHQNKIHENCKSKQSVLEYTVMTRDQIEKSKSHPTNSILPCGLPLPLIRGKSPLFFCYLCNYRHKNIALINGHFFKVHKGCRVDSAQILEHTSVIYERLRASSPIKSTEQNKDTLLEHVKKLKITKLRKPKYLPPSQVRLKCFKCPYVSHHVYLMRKHLIAGHKANMSFADIVRICGTGAQFEPGYYCDMCSFRCGDVVEVKTHSIERHCGRSLSIQFMSTRMYLSPDMCDPKKRSKSFNNDDIPDGNLPKTYPEAYSCKACSFKGTSFSSITSHYQAVHPSSVKDSGSMLDVGNSSKKLILSNKKLASQQDFDSYKVPLDFDNKNVSTAQAKEYSCSYCPATFGGHGGLIIHVGMKHRDRIEETPSLAKRMQVFKCRSCSYVNNIRSGVLTHTKMKHPNKALKSGNFYVESKHLHNVEMKVKNGNWKFCGYICKECPQIFSSKEKLNEHRKTHKKQPMLNLVTPALDSSKPIHEEIWCQFCGLFCATAKDHSEHLCVCPKNSSTYPCALCSDTFCTKVQLGLHYTKKHGEEAFFKHYAPLYNQPSDKTDQQKETSIQSTVSQTEILRMFKCPSCRYVNASHHGTLTHCQMRHPKVVVRAETLKTIDIDIANMIGYLPNSKKYGGFRCKKCPFIYGTLKKLKRHCETGHNTKAGASSQPLAHTPQLSVDQNIGPESASSSQTKIVTKFRHYFKCSLCSYSSSLLKSLGRHYRNRHGKAAYSKFYSPLFNQFNKTPKSQVKYEQAGKSEKAEDTPEKATPQVRVYKCSICSYGTPYRRYLIAHFRNRHKLETKAISKQMEKFKNWEPILPIGRFTCKKCLNVFFPSKMRLLAHYVKVHSSEVVDFTIVAERTYRTTGVYRCNRCKQKIFGIKNIYKHLDQHRAKLMKIKHKEMEIKVEVSAEKPPPTLHPMEDETIKSPPASTVSLLNAEVPELPSEGKHTCLRCKRTFMSLKGLRSHERSHAAFAALGNFSNSESKEHIDQYIVYRHGTTRPYMCKLCPYRTTVLGMGKSHFLKKHRHISNSARVDRHFEEETQHVKEAAPNIINDLNADGDEEPENSFLEPPDVQRQLNHYNVMAQIDPAATRQDKIHLSDPRMLPCEMCNFNSHHYANMRRHYLRRHGKKLIRCKDCSFFTCFKQNLDLHEQMGHSCVQSEPTHQKNLCCPFCLYQSKNKNNMIDHIVLHREERMMPIEVRRSKLSRYLRGIVFRCYKCTFTSGSADSLDSHMAKHSDIKPFKCRLCYFDCTQLRDLEEHLCDKHQVVRNHQLVGQVSLDQLEEKEDRNSLSEDDEYDEILHDPHNLEQALKNEQPNNELTEAAEDPIKEKESNEHILKDDVSLDIPNTQNISRQNAGVGFKDHTDNNDAQLDENNMTTKPKLKLEKR
uniref:C2H2-type domain-containing protein n=1 Tax=Neogobius melanostomus TaxID=47308 RepID=A0A8C6UPC2_9GOBI